jgi:hypothetical protein
MKRQRYAQSNIVITRELAAFDRWGEEEIRSRGRALANEASRIWIGPKEQIVRREADSAGDDEGPGRLELRARFWRGLNDFLVAEHPDLPDFDARQSWTIRVPSGLRHIGFELRYGLRHRNVGIDVWFWRAASMPLWQRIRQHPDSYNELIGTTWEFEQVEGQERARMSLSREADVRDESSWPALYQWFGETLSLLYERVAPKLRDDMERGGDA